MAEEEGKDIEGKVEKGYLSTMIEALSYLVKDEMYGPLDVLATTPDLQLAYGVLYNAIRYLASKGYPVPTEEDLNVFFAMVRKRPEVLREVAIKAFVRGIMKSAEEEAEEKKAEEKSSTKG